jgi:anionic cell wall polymer biosynthesis LytR-Cps2A-Psr (LCP) family protein
MDQFKKRFLAAARTPVGAAVLSFLLPGLGQAANGQRNRGAIIAIPALSVLAALLVIGLFERGTALDSAFDKTWLTSLLIVDLVALIYHLWAVLDAYLTAGKDPTRQRRSSRTTRSSAATIGVILVVVSTVGVHAGIASLDADVQGFVSNIGGDAPAWAGSLAPGQTIAITSDDPGDVSIVDPSGSGSASATPSGPVGTLDPNQLPVIDSPPEAKNWDADGQLNVLLVGVDAGLGGGRSQGLRPDTMMLLHEDIKTGKAALIGIPRNLMCVPLPQAIAAHYSSGSNGCPGSTWPQMLNWLANDAGWNHPSYYPFYQGTGNIAYTRAMTATEEAIGTLTGLTSASGHPIDGFVVINLMGLVNLIDAIGGIDINVPTTVYDKPCGKAGTWEAQFRVCQLSPAHDGYGLPQGDGSGPSQNMVNDAKNSNGMQTINWKSSNGYDIAFTIKAGQQHMDGDWALAYARTRIYTTDYDRMKRQQLVLKSLRGSLNPCTMLPQVPGIMHTLGTALWTNMPPGDISRWAGMAKYITGGNVKTITLDPATIGGSTYINTTEWNNIKNLVSHSLDNVPAATGGSSGGGGFSC